MTITQAFWTATRRPRLTLKPQSLLAIHTEMVWEDKEKSDAPCGDGDANHHSAAVWPLEGRDSIGAGDEREETITPPLVQAASAGSVC